MVGLSTVLAVVVMLPQVQDFVSEDARHDDLLVAAKQLEALSPYLSSQQDDRMIREAISQVQKAAFQAFTLLKEGRVHEADIPMLLAEEDVEYVRRIFGDRLRFSLLEELHSRLAQAEADIAALSDEFEGAGISRDSLAGIQQQISTSKEAVGSVPESLTDTPAWLDKFSQLFDQIAETRTALRFYKNSNTGVDSVRQQVAQGVHIENTARVLDVSTVDAEKCRFALSAALDAFVKGRFSTHQDLIAGYASIQRALREYRKQLAVVETQIASMHHRMELVSGTLLAFVPRSCSTHQTSTGAIISVASAGRDTLSVSIDGTLLELPSDRVFTCRPSPSPEVHGFAIAGKRGGKAKLKIKVSGHHEPVERTVAIEVVASVAERARDAALIIPFGAIAAIPTIHFGWELRDAVSLGAIVGAALALIAFTFRLRYRR
jgi:hypothetical protein